MKNIRLFGLSALASLAFVPACATAQAARASDSPPTIRVDGVATVEREPDRAILTLAVESEGATAQAASQANADLMTRVIGALRQEQLTGSMVRTMSLRLQPTYSQGPDRETPRIVGYRAMNQVQATIDDVGRVGRVIDAAINAGSNRVDGVNFVLRDPSQARLAALAAAVENAHGEAEVVAAAAGGVLGQPIEIVLSPAGNGPRPVMYERSLAAMGQAAETPVEGGTISISATVTVIYRLDIR